MEDPKYIENVIAKYVELKLGPIGKSRHTSLAMTNIWPIVIDFEKKTGVALNDKQLKKCTLVKDLISVLYGHYILKSRAHLDEILTYISENADSINNIY